MKFDHMNLFQTCRKIRIEFLEFSVRPVLTLERPKFETLRNGDNTRLRKQKVPEAFSGTEDDTRQSKRRSINQKSQTKVKLKIDRQHTYWTRNEKLLFIVVNLNQFRGRARNSV